MKKILLLLVVLVSSVTFAQNNGITYQAVIYSTSGESVPGIKNSNSPLSNKAICLQFSIVDTNLSTEYQEKVTVTTDDYGMVNLVIGNGTQTGGYANSFNAIVWSNPNKYLKVSVDQTGNCSSFELFSDQILTYVPFALAANSTTSVSGIVGIANGGTNATTVLGAKTNLQLQNVDNTSDLNKPLSTATQIALNTKVDKVSGKELSTNDYTTIEKNKLAAIIGTNTGDQDLSSYATNVALATKVDKVTGKELSTNDYTTVEKTKLDAITGTNTGDQDLSLYATTNSVALKANAANVTSILATKVDKVTGKELSSNDYTTVDKTKLAAISGLNTGDQDLSLYATNANLVLKAPLASPNFTGVMGLNNRAEFGQNNEREQPSLKLIGYSKSGNGVNSFWPTQPYAGGGLEIGDGGAVRLVIYRKSSNSFNISTTGSLHEGIGINADSYDPAYTLDINGTLGVRNSITSTGTITAGSVTYPNLDGTSGQVLTTNGAGILAWTSPSGRGSTIVGAISNSSNTNGASIAADELNLAPADANNGGIVTTGTQTFSGSKTILGSLIIDTVNSSPTIDQSHLVSYGGYGAGQSALGQSFTAGVSGTLNKVSMKFINSTCNGILKIYSGEGIAGALLTSQAFSLSSVNGDIEFILTSPFQVVYGAIYTILFEKSSGNIDVWNSNDGSYNRGQAYAWGGLQSNLDNVFKTFVSTVSGGLITASGFKTPNGISSQYLMADGSVMSSTLSNYIPVSGGNMTGQLAIGTSSPQTSAILDITSTTQGFLPPRMTKDQRNAIVNKVAGLIVWCKNCGENGELQVYNGSSWTNFIGGLTSEPMAVGSSYKGGKIAYIFQIADPGYVAGEFHGIIASNSDLSNGVRWGQGYDGLTTTYDCTNRHGSSGYALPCAIGSGNANTMRIISSNTETNPTDYAALICSNYSTISNGITYDDWFLPSYNEMIKLFENKSLFGGLYYDSTNSGSKSNWYWTSTGDVFQDRAADVNSNDGGKARNFRGSLLSVRAIRYF